MGASQNSKQFLGKLHDFQTRVNRTAYEGVRQGAEIGKSIVLTQAAGRGVGPTSKIAKRKWSVRYDLKGRGNPTALLAIRGPFHLVESDTKAHTIGAKGLGTRSFFRQVNPGPGAFTGGRARRGKRALSWAGAQHPAPYAMHPGTKGKHIWEHSKTLIEREVPLVVARRMRASMTDVFR